jgi:hypothetical protein
MKPAGLEAVLTDRVPVERAPISQPNPRRSTGAAVRLIDRREAGSAYQRTLR